MRAKWFQISLAYSIAKMNMSMCALGHAEEFKNEIAGKILFNYELLRFLLSIKFLKSILYGL